MSLRNSLMYALESLFLLSEFFECFSFLILIYACIQEQDKIDIQTEEAREKIKKKVMNAAGLKAPKPKPRKNVKKASVVESTAEPMDVSVASTAETG